MARHLATLWCTVSEYGRHPHAFGRRARRHSSSCYEPPTQGVSRRQFGNDPSAGSPTETLLRLLLPLNDPARVFFRRPKGWLPASVRPGREARSPVGGPGPEGASPTSLLDHSSEIATGGVYKGQGRSRCSLMNCAYGGFLVRGKHFQSPVPFMNGFDEITHSSRSREELAVPPIVARVRPRTSKGITDLLWLPF